jgi:methyl-accepting chemotaxis protein WspA
MSIKQKIWLSLSLMIGGYFISMVFGFVYGQRTESRLYGVSEHLFPASSQSQSALASFERGIKLYDDAVVLGDVSSADDARSILEDAQAALRSIVTLNGFNAQKKADVEKALNDLMSFSESAYPVYKQMSAGLNTSEDQGKAVEQSLDEKAKELAEQTKRLRVTLTSLTSMFADDLKAELKIISQDTRNQRVLNLIIFCIVIATTTILVSILITRSVVSPIKKALSFSDAIAKGDFTARIQNVQTDELGMLLTGLSQMAENLNALVGQVQQTGFKVSSSTTELSATAKQQEVIIANQVQSTEHVVKAVQEISQVSSDLVQTMRQVAAISQETTGFASSGQSDLTRMRDAMSQMETASKTISGRLQAIHEKAENITNVVITITKVADQTNLLSLNASIEAEKAGEYGRGFTVVAREIRRLADQTAVATLDIEQMVQEMQSAVSSGIMEMDKFIQQVQHSTEDVGKISLQLTRIIEQVQALSPSFEEVSVAMQHQSDNAQQINTAMVNLSQEMQQTKDSLYETYQTIEQLNDAAGGLREEVSRFKVS